MLQMPITYKHKTSRGTTPHVLERAATVVLQKQQFLQNVALALRNVALAYSIDKMTLHRYCKKVKAAMTDNDRVSTATTPTYQMLLKVILSYIWYRLPKCFLACLQRK